MRKLFSTIVILLGLGVGSAVANPDFWRAEWPRTDFSRTIVSFKEIFSGGPPKDGIPAIDNPSFVDVETGARGLASTEPVISIEINGYARAYPLRILTWHEIVNDELGEVPITVTYCPLCNAAIVFDRRLDGRILDFGTTGKLRNSDLVMYDRQTESWWQQFLGEAIVGELTGARLKTLPSRLESVAKYRERHPRGTILIPRNEGTRPYGRNPYVGYDSASTPFLYSGSMPEGIAPLARVVAVGNKAWSLDLLRRKQRIEDGDLVLSWEAGQNSALDSNDITQGKDVGNVVVQRRTDRGLVDSVYDVTFAFVFHAFRPDGELIR